jgi:7-cyano-7-deazaguanine synthase in queuosine biosynthesis
MAATVRWRSGPKNGRVTLRHSPERNPNFALGISAFEGYLNGMQLPAALDLIRVAAIVYVADTSIERSSDLAVYGEGWTRDLDFTIPVLEPDRWNSPEVRDALAETLGFLTGDRYQFAFEPWSEAVQQQYLQLFNSTAELTDTDCVSLFSGGIDSLVCAAMLQAAGRKPLLVSHRSGTRLLSRRGELIEALRSSSAAPFRHWPVEIHRASDEAKERSQRSRSFLYAALGVSAAASLRFKDVYISDNGITTANIIYSQLAQGSEATRSTHPRFLTTFNALTRQLMDHAPVAKNLLLSMTKADVVIWLADHGLASLLPLTTSCARTHMTTRVQPHCGTCSQCIDRRFAVAFAGQEAQDTLYQTDIFTEAIPVGHEATLAEGYVRFAGDLEDRSGDYFANQFPVFELVTGLSNIEEQVQAWWTLHQRHAEQVLKVFAAKLTENSPSLARGELPPACLLRIVSGGRLEPIHAAMDYLERLFRKSIPPMFKSQRPVNERDLQDKVEGLLMAQRDNFHREHPGVRFLGKTFTPDFSPKLRPLAIELKFPRSGRARGAIIEEIAADITAYRGKAIPMLFVVYDPDALMSSESELRSELAQDTARDVFLVVVK